MISLKNKSFKLTKADIINIKGYIFENDKRIKDGDSYRYLSSEEFKEQIKKDKGLNAKTIFYINECKKLKECDLRDVDNNLKQLNLL